MNWDEYMCALFERLFMICPIKLIISSDNQSFLIMDKKFVDDMEQFPILATTQFLSFPDNCTNSM
jgi:hypothetical protein